MHVLVIQSNRNILLGIAHLVKSYGLSVETAKSIDESKIKIAPDALIIDETCASGCGLEAVQNLWQEVGIFPKVILTLDSAHTMNRYGSSGSVNVMSQPLDPNLLEVCLKTESNGNQAIA